MCIEVYACLDRKATDPNFIVLYLYLSSGWAAIETKMATKYFYELVSFDVTDYHSHYFKQSSTFDSFSWVLILQTNVFWKEHCQFIVIIDLEIFNTVPHLLFYKTIQGVSVLFSILI